MVTRCAGTVAGFVIKIPKANWRKQIVGGLSDLLVVKDTRSQPSWTIPICVLHDTKSEHWPEYTNHIEQGAFKE